MTSNRIAASAASVALTVMLTAVSLLPSGVAGAATQTTIPQTASAQTAANWLAGQIGSDGSIPSSTSPGSPDLTATANAVLALASAGVNHAQAAAALSFLEGHVNAYVTVGGSDGPGQLALLILDANSLGVAPTSFGGVNLVARLVATQQATGTNAGLFGAQDATYDGAYRQGLSLAALAVAGVTTGAAVTAATSWLTSQQCPNGGWTSLVTAVNPCNGKPAVYAGPDTNSTALAVEGLEAQGALSASAASSALRFLKKAENSDGGWGYEPNSAKAPGSSDPDSTALVVQAMLALGAAPTSATFTRSGSNPITSILSNQVAAGPGTGGISFPGISGVDLLATYQAIPALAGVTFAYNLSAPAVTRVGPSHGATAGGSTVRLTGTSFAEAQSVMFGSTPASSFTVNSGTSITAMVPPGVVGAVTVTVGSPFGASAATAAARFTYR